MNGARANSSRGPAGIASWFSPGPYGIHPTADGFLAISMAAPADLSKALDVPELAAFSERDSFSKREAITKLVTQRLLTRSTKDWLPSLEQKKSGMRLCRTTAICRLIRNCSISGPLSPQRAPPARPLRCSLIQRSMTAITDDPSRSAAARRADTHDHDRTRLCAG